MIVSMPQRQATLCRVQLSAMTTFEVQNSELGAEIRCSVLVHIQVDLSTVLWHQHRCYP